MEKEDKNTIYGFSTQYYVKIYNRNISQSKLIGIRNAFTDIIRVYNFFFF